MEGEEGYQEEEEGGQEEEEGKQEEEQEEVKIGEEEGMEEGERGENGARLGEEKTNVNHDTEKKENANCRLDICSKALTPMNSIQLLSSSYGKTNVVGVGKKEKKCP